MFNHLSVGRQAALHVTRGWIEACQFQKLPPVGAVTDPPPPGIHRMWNSLSVGRQAALHVTRELIHRFTHAGTERVAGGWRRGWGWEGAALRWTVGQFASYLAILKQDG